MCHARSRFACSFLRIEVGVSSNVAKVGASRSKGTRTAECFVVERKGGRLEVGGGPETYPVLSRSFPHPHSMECNCGSDLSDKAVIIGRPRRQCKCTFAIDANNCGHQDLRPARTAIPPIHAVGRSQSTARTQHADRARTMQLAMQCEIQRFIRNTFVSGASPMLPLLERALKS